MKPRTYFGLALLFPYLLWVICVLVVVILSSKEITPAVNAVVTPFFLYAFGILAWFIPYTLLAIGMWLWSKNRSIQALNKMALVAPIILSILLIVEVILVLLPGKNWADLAKDLPVQAASIAGFSLVFGYLCVGIAFGLFRLLQARHFIAQETLSQI